MFAVNSLLYTARRDGERDDIDCGLLRRWVDVIIGATKFIRSLGNSDVSLTSTTIAMPFSRTISLHELHTSWHIARWNTVRNGKMIGSVISAVVGASLHCFLDGGDDGGDADGDAAKDGYNCD